MNETVNIWKLFAGLGIFLMGMYQLEQALKELGGRSFKRFIRQHTQNPVKGVFVGTIATALLQSSSLVSLIVLAFVGTGILSIRNALGIIIGSNLGTTFKGWIVAIVGFKLNLESFVFPIVAFGCLGFIFSRAKSRSYFIFQIFLGIGFLLLGISDRPLIIVLWIDGEILSA